MSSPKNNQAAAAVSSSNRKRKKSFPVLVLITSGVLLLLTLAILLGYLLLIPREMLPRPLVFIHSPENGALVHLGEQVIIHATSRDESRITRMELWVDGVLHEVERSEIESGITPFPMLVSWQPDAVGEHTITFRAFNSRGGRAHASLRVEAGLGTDRDLDGVADADDGCPDQPGAEENNGCPLDGDVDGDGIPDGEDLCPEEPGVEDVEGCPDRDGDGVPDGEDAEPDLAGPADTDGAPDSDGDLVPDRDDLSPESSGEPGSGGAPDTGAGDRDGDGAADDVDPCPDDPGLPEDGFCPPPGDDLPPEEGDSPFDWSDYLVDWSIPQLIEIEAYQFRVDRDYDRVWCYVSLAGSAVERYEFEPQDELQWDIAQELAGENSRVMIIPRESPLQVMIECAGETVDLGLGGGSGVVHHLGTYTAAHESEEWDGRQLIANGYGESGEFFAAGYRICSPSCEETAIQPPLLSDITTGPRGEGPYQIRWRWEGDEDWLRGFEMMVNGTFYDSLTSIPPDQTRLDLEEFQPLCGEVLEFRLRAFGMNPEDDTIQHSPFSNTAIWDGRTCPRTIMVSFLSLDGHGLSGQAGPLYGSFFANDQMLTADYRDGPPSFDARDDTEQYLNPGQEINLASLFDVIEREARGCLGSSCTSNFAPSVNYLEVELGPTQSLTVGGSIWTERDGRAFEESLTIQPGEITPGVHQITQNGITLTVGIDVVVGPEAGGEEQLPDLTITDVTMNDAGQLEVHVFNNAADLVSEDINIAVVQMSTNEQIDFLTWQDVTIPAGGLRRLVSPSAAAEPYDLRLLLDPADESGEGGIPETDELNNVYETPVTIRVDLLSFYPGDACESFLAAHAEYRFRVWIAHRSPEGDLTTIYSINHPQDEELRFYFHRTEDRLIGPWDVRDIPEFEYEFEMPADHELVIIADGYEDDSGSSLDDFAGRINAVYPPEDNYGDRADNYHYVSEGWHECHDGDSPVHDSFEFHMYWNITRVH